MTDDRALLDAIARAIASVPAARAPEAVLAAIMETHVVIERGTAMHIRSVLMGANRTLAARTLDELILTPGDFDP